MFEKNPGDEKKKIYKKLWRFRNILENFLRYFTVWRTFKKNFGAREIMKKKSRETLKFKKNSRTQDRIL